MRSFILNPRNFKCKFLKNKERNCNKLLKTLRNILFFSIILFFLSFRFLSAPVEMNQEIISAIKTGNSKELAKYFNTTIELTVPEHEGNFSKVQAELLVKNFFIKYPPKSFTVNNKGKSRGGSSYTIGTLVTGNGTFRTYYLIKNISGANCIQQLLFEIQKK